MGKRYYCDYCDRSFQDNMHNRKKHLNGVLHHRAKKSWFDHFRDSAAILSEEQAKMPCRKFLQTGNCGFGPSCRFSHMSEEDMESLKRQMEDENRRGDEPGRSSSECRVEEWLCRREKRRSVLCSGGVVEEKEDDEEDQTRGDVPPQLLSIPDLPPSLLPPPPGGWRLRLNTDWG